MWWHKRSVKAVPELLQSGIRGQSLWSRFIYEGQLRKSMASVNQRERKVVVACVSQSERMARCRGDPCGRPGLRAACGRPQGSPLLIYRPHDAPPFRLADAGG